MIKKMFISFSYGERDFLDFVNSFFISFFYTAIFAKAYK
jgi:hypothetical protein